jgi:hypothetical protein
MSEFVAQKNLLCFVLQEGASTAKKKRKNGRDVDRTTVVDVCMATHYEKLATIADRIV